jgi:lysozyme family protein
MADFELSIKKTLLNEGGDKYTETLNDNGGATKFGISLRFMVGVFESSDELKKAKGTVIERLFIRCPTKDTIRYLTECEAKFIYKLYFWDANRYGEIEDQAIAEKVFDMAVLMGAPRANKNLQYAVSCIYSVTSIDGIIGDKTLHNINLSTQKKLYLMTFYKDACINSFIEICNKDKSQSKFLLGWLNRVMS